MNQPPITFLSSINPTTKAAEVVIIIAIIPLSGINAYKTISAARIPIMIEIPPGLATITSPVLLKSFTQRFFFSSHFIKNGVIAKTVKNAITDDTIAAII